MVYKVGSKVYTESPILDELVYNTKLILAGLVVKNQSVADMYETEETIQRSGELSKCVRGLATFANVPMSQEMLTSLGYSEDEALYILYDRTVIPEEDRETVLEYAVQYYIDNFEELNKYYRSLLGLPEYGTTIYDIKVDSSWIPEDYTEPIDYSLPLHEQPISVINLLQGNGVIDKLIDQYRSFNYSYLRFLGDNALNIYNCRSAGKWDILYMPDVAVLVSNRFQELYNLNKELYLRKVWQEAYEYDSEYYEHICILMLIAQTFNDMVVDTPNWYIRRDIFDIRSVQFFLESYGVEFFSQIPLKYQIRIVKNLNKLLKYKSSNRNNYDILEIFGLEGTEIYKYYLYKRRNIDPNTGEYVVDPDLNKMYTLEFIQCKLEDTYDNYIKNNDYIEDYDSVTTEDQYWDGGQDHQAVHDEIMQKDFIIEPTKYMIIRTDVDYDNYMNQIKFILGLILDSKVDLDDITVGISYIAPGVNFKLSNLFIFICAISDAYDMISGRKRTPSETDEPYTDYKDDYVPASDDWWLKREYPEFFTVDRHRVCGFNPLVDIEEVQEVIGRQFTNYTHHMGGYTLEDFGVDSFIVPESAHSFDELVNLYTNNLECYENIQHFITYKADNKDIAKAAEFVSDQLFTREFDDDFYQDKLYLEDVLKARDYTLYDFYKKVIAEPDVGTRRENIAMVLNEVISILEFYLDRSNLDYLFTFTPIGSFSAIQTYVMLMLNAFKSYKVQFLSPVIVYNINSSSENFVRIFDTITEKRVMLEKYFKHFVNDVLRIQDIYAKQDYYRMTMREIVDIHHGFEPLAGDDYDYDGKGAADESEAYKDADGTSATMLYPYNMIDGNRANSNRLDTWLLEGGNISEDQSHIVYSRRVDGGSIMDDEIHLSNITSILTKKFNNVIDCGNPKTNTLIYHKYFKRVTDHQMSMSTRHLIAAYTGVRFNNDEYNYDEEWRYWRTLGEFLHDHYGLDLYTLENFYNTDPVIKLHDNDYCDDPSPFINNEDRPTTISNTIHDNY